MIIEQLIRHDLETDEVQDVVDAPDAPAVCAWDGSMTYRELDYRSSFLSAYLVEQGAGPEVFISLCLEKSMWVAVAVCAVLKAGAAFCLLDVSFPPQRLQVMCDQLDATLVLTSAHSLDLARQPQLQRRAGSSVPASHAQCIPFLGRAPERFIHDRIMLSEL